jgi:tripartite-type tricarboxylate transporter receptor subunit TctC
LNQFRPSVSRSSWKIGVGANGSVAGEPIARSPADSYTLLWAATPSIAIAPALGRLSYDPISDLAPISVVGINGFVLLVRRPEAIYRKAALMVIKNAP